MKTSFTLIRVSIIAPCGHRHSALELEKNCNLDLVALTKFNIFFSNRAGGKIGNTMKNVWMNEPSNVHVDFREKL